MSSNNMSPNTTNIYKLHILKYFHKSRINISNIYHLRLVIVSIISVVAPAIRLPNALLTCRELGHEQLHLSMSSLHTGDPLSFGLL